MDEISTGSMLLLLLFLILCSAFFSSSETGMMALNRYRLKHLAKQGHKGAKRASKLLERPDRLLGLILIGNNFVNILLTSLATALAISLLSDDSLAVALTPVILTPIVLIFAEVAPKTLAALNPEKLAFTSSIILKPLLVLMYPLVWLVNWISNIVVRMLGADPNKMDGDSLSQEELRTVVHEAGGMIPKRHQQMLLSILDLEKVTVEDIMIPRTELIGIDLEDDWQDIVEQLANTQHTRIPVFEGDINNIQGIVHARNALHLLAKGRFTRDTLMQQMRDAYFVPEGTPLHTQLLNFQRKKRRNGLVVDEYGDIQGMVTLEDILEEIVGEFTTDTASLDKGVHPQEDGSFVVDGGISIRELNRLLSLTFPEDGPKTLSGLITEYLEEIPEQGTSMRLAGYPVEVMQTKDNTVKKARVLPELFDEAKAKQFLDNR
ncbi:HlyC/CorC family transporter [Pelagibaculum spongiae]|uniref:Magnesium and cobalt efflux protein CorC n=1 Tax=Pelagibaculum spongiae TaxID=2080658 RepID=A0A2V1GW97_9GAMM|nr:HlyC/CorC family transporter [Pelagibaculum spongiae]PVZ62988.1 magnesium/cobalt efflux protein [Pelagibaculum spongiae]